MSTASAGMRRAVAMLAIASLATALSLAPAASPAQGKKGGGAKLKTATGTATALGAFDPATAVASCPAGTKVVAGGYSTSVPSMGSHWLNVNESQRLTQRSWQVSGVEYFSGTDTLTAYAYCQALKGKVESRSAQVALPATAGAGAVVQATCPKGTKAISGGFAIEAANASDSSYVSRSIAAGGNRWVVDATRLTGAAGRSLIANVYCAEVEKQKTRSQSAAVLGPLGSQYTATTGACPKKLSTRGGGFATSTPVGGLMNAALVYENRRAGAGWSASATPSSAGTSITLLTNAYCR